MGRKSEATAAGWQALLEAIKRECATVGPFGEVEVRICLHQDLPRSMDILRRRVLFHIPKGTVRQTLKEKDAKLKKDGQ